MPYLIQNLLENKPPIVSVSHSDRAGRAMELMTDGDYSQLPVIDAERCVIGLVTSDSILKTARMFGIEASLLGVRDCQISPKLYAPDTDLFEVLQGLELNGSVIIVDDTETKKLIGIVTDFDTAKYFRQRAESAMMVQEIEGLLKEFIRYPFSAKPGSDITAAIASATVPSWERERFKSALCKYQQETGGEAKPNDAALEVAFGVLLKAPAQKPRSIDDLDFKELMLMFLATERWDGYASIVKLEKAALDVMLEKVRKVRNKIAHFRGEVTKDELDTLKRSLEWLKGIRPELESHFSESQEQIAAEIEKQEESIEEALKQSATAIGKQTEPLEDMKEEAAEEKAKDNAERKANPLVPNTKARQTFDLLNAKKYSALHRWLGGVPADREYTWTSFGKIEDLIGVRLPEAAFEQRSWWSNDWNDDSPAQLWLHAGWEVEFVNLDEEQVRFRRGQFE